MKESNHQSTIEWTRKEIESSRHLFNLRYLLKLNPEILPQIDDISADYYLMEVCQPIEYADFAPSNLTQLHQTLFAALHRFKRDRFTPGIYKYFTPYSITYKSRTTNYIPHVLQQLKRILDRMSKVLSQLPSDNTLTSLLRYIEHVSSQPEDWTPAAGYSLLHGDLHIGNIVKKNNRFLLIDYEYLRYGAAEMELANFVISALIWVYKRGGSDNDAERTRRLVRAIYDYDEACRHVDSIDFVALKFFCAIALCLSYLSAYVKNDWRAMQCAAKILALYLSR
jgi:hypothetical protein